MSEYINRYTDKPRFAGDSFDPDIDENRLLKQLDRIRLRMLTGKRYTLRKLADECGCSEASASARIRDVRREGRTCGWDVKKRRVSGGLWEYWCEFRSGGEAIG